MASVRGSFLMLILVALVLANLLCVYKLVDQSVSLDHSRQEQMNERATIMLLCKLIQKSNPHLTKPNLMELLKKEFVGYPIKETGDKVIIDNVVFEIRDDNLIEVTIM